MNLQPLKWSRTLTTETPFRSYRVRSEGNDKFAVYYESETGEPATGFTSVDDAMEWAEHTHYAGEMQPWLDASKYPAQFEEDFNEVLGAMGYDCLTPNGFTVTFRDVPEAITQGDTFIEALEMAQDALQTAMEFYDEANKPRPKPSAAIHGDVMIDINSEVTK